MRGCEESGLPQKVLPQNTHNKRVRNCVLDGKQIALIGLFGQIIHQLWPIMMDAQRGERAKDKGN